MRRHGYRVGKLIFYQGSEVCNDRYRKARRATRGRQEAVAQAREASPKFFVGFEESVEKRKRREKTPELSELRELKARLRRAAWAR
jgi:hypothetical protein